MFLRFSALAVVLATGCVTGDGALPQTDAVQQNAGGNGGGDCDVFMCGTNSPQIAEFGFWDLNLPTTLGLPGLPNNMSIEVLGFVQGSQLYLPKVFAGRLTASRVSTVPPYDTITLSGAALVNGVLLLRNGTRMFKIRISEVGNVASWARPVRGGNVFLESYKLDWFELKQNQQGVWNWGDPKNVCKNPPNVEDRNSLTMTGQFSFHTLLFEGDRIDAAKKLDTGVEAGWINLGCAGSALAKMALTGHTEASRNAGTFSTTLPERQTMLKMLTGDYCGDGTPFTVGGQPLNWRDDRGTMKLAALLVNPPQPLVRESRWTDKGAACLDKPRVDVHWTAAGDAEFGPDVYHQIQNHCPDTFPPQCSDSTFETAGYHLLTATVPFQP